MTRRHDVTRDYQAAVAALIALHRHLLAAALVLALLLGCAGCGWLAYSLGAQHEYSVNWNGLSAGAIVDGCRVKAGYYDAASGRNDSGEWVLCR